MRTAICCLVVIGLLAPASAANISGTWELTIYYQPDDKDYLATYILKQEGEKVSGRYEGLYGPAEVTGAVKSSDVTLSVTVKSSTARFTGTVTSATTMSGTVTGTSDKPRKWSAEKKK
jgi:hypothetical protein